MWYVQQWLILESTTKKYASSEENSNQILDFTKEVKMMDEEKKIDLFIYFGLTRVFFADFFKGP